MNMSIYVLLLILQTLTLPPKVSTPATLTFSSLPPDHGCTVIVTYTGKVTLTNCKDTDEAARNFWHAVEHNAPCSALKDSK